MVDAVAAGKVVEHDVAANWLGGDAETVPLFLSVLEYLDGVGGVGVFDLANGGRAARRRVADKRCHYAIRVAALLLIFRDLDALAQQPVDCLLQGREVIRVGGPLGLPRPLQHAGSCVISDLVRYSRGLSAIRSSAARARTASCVESDGIGRLLWCLLDGVEGLVGAHLTRAGSLRRYPAANTQTVVTAAYAAGGTSTPSRVRATQISNASALAAVAAVTFGLMSFMVYILSVSRVTIPPMAAAMVAQPRTIRPR